MGIASGSMAENYTLNMIPQRDIEEGIAMEMGKTSPEYYEACNLIEMNETDIKKLGILKNTIARVTSESGQVVVKAVVARQTIYWGLC
jgi:formylmethanofuran dehydrogenase subunit D